MTGQPDFDVIVVGAGLAGAVAAHQLAQAGLNVALLERGSQAGSKNLSGGVLQCQGLKTVFPDFLDQAPVERVIDRQQLCFLNQSSHVTLDYADQRLRQAGSAVTVRRARLDPWLAERAEAAGAIVMTGIRVDALLRQDGQIAGVTAGADELRSRVVVLADGANSFLSRLAGLRRAPARHQQAVGVKATFKLPAETIEERCQIDPAGGLALTMVGDCTQGVAGGGFLYTNRDSLSVGLVLNLGELVRRGGDSSLLFERLLAHPLISRLLRDSQLLEYGCHLVNEGGLAMVGRTVFDGLVLVGDAAGLTINTGLTIRGMDLAVSSALAAAAGVTRAIAADDTSAAGLKECRDAFDRSAAGQDLRLFAQAPAFLANERLYGPYGELLADLMFGLHHLDLSPRRHLLAQARRSLRRSPLSLGRLLLDGLKGARAL
ncbi:MAG: FAD-dependent oxidoreductase [Propionibacteriaceae bacterium]|jgi:electron transfer flavoprotein-quinone oxidoreductase|nr:FAD-dependent oxidoreductase [Propionibacteriaceae bacterium]